MRSRYTAFATGAVDYLWRTLHPDHPDRQRPMDAWRLELRRYCRQTRFLGLQVRQATDRDASGAATVTFHARLFQAGRDMSFTERSTFRNDGTGWRYLSGDMLRE